MSYSELVKELKLENRLMAVTRVHAKDEKVNDIFGCVYKRFERVLNGETLVLRFLQLRGFRSQQRTQRRKTEDPRRIRRISVLWFRPAVDAARRKIQVRSTNGRCYVPAAS